MCGVGGLWFAVWGYNYRGNIGFVGGWVRWGMYGVWVVVGSGGGVGDLGCVGGCVGNMGFVCGFV